MPVFLLIGKEVPDAMLRAPLRLLMGVYNPRFASCACPLNAITPGPIRLRFNSKPFIGSDPADTRSQR